jgi:hypothetical protein
MVIRPPSTPHLYFSKLIRNSDYRDNPSVRHMLAAVVLVAAGDRFLDMMLPTFREPRPIPPSSGPSRLKDEAQELSPDSMSQSNRLVCVSRVHLLQIAASDDFTKAMMAEDAADGVGTFFGSICYYVPDIGNCIRNLMHVACAAKWQEVRTIPPSTLP